MRFSEAEKKLASYRSKKQKAEKINLYKSKFIGMFSSVFKKENPTIEPNEENLNVPRLQSGTSKDLDFSDVESFDDDFSETKQNSVLTVFDYIQYTLWLFLWIIVYSIFIKLEFGTIYLIISGIVGMYLNTRTGPKQKNEISAYSVFNKNCESIDGTLDGEQMTKQMIYGGFPSN